ncbi:hypothetical protein HDV00_008129 [Rhizophlyctis rosea]|nr:hypothetical protein HDV00_008129 [Rhizophlyctis rosea]
MWTLQEAALARELVLVGISGNVSVQLDRRELSKREKLQEGKRYQFIRTPLLDLFLPHKDSYTVADLMTMAVDRAVARPQDKVYACRGLNAAAHAVPVDYSVDLAEATARWFRSAVSCGDGSWLGLVGTAPPGYGSSLIPNLMDPTLHLIVKAQVWDVSPVEVTEGSLVKASWHSTPTDGLIYADFRAVYDLMIPMLDKFIEGIEARGDGGLADFNGGGRGALYDLARGFQQSADWGRREGFLTARNEFLRVFHKQFKEQFFDGDRLLLVAKATGAK